jgi:hypothetical protein
MRVNRHPQHGTLGRKVVLGMRAGAGGFLLLGALSLYVATTASSASASTLGGTATITDPISDLPVSSGGSTTVFTVVLTPSPADCSGDTATDGYHVYSYLLPQATAVTTDNFSTGSPSEGLGLVDSSGYYGPANTAPTTGEIFNIPADFEWADLLNLGETAAELDGGSSAVWDAGIACANASGTLTDYWNTVVSFTADTDDPNGFAWSATPGVGSTTTTTTIGGSTTTTVGGSTTTTIGGSTTTTIGGSTTTTIGGATTTTVGGSTTSTTGGSTSSGNATTTSAPVSTPGASDSSNGSGTGATQASGGSLAFTGALITRSLAIGLLCIGFGMILLGLSVKVRRDLAPRVVLR